jgi:FtsP/CotA-like multicopper oxidase with cupredoxin domain
MHVRRHVIHLVTVVVSLTVLTGAAVVGWAWKTSLLPDSYDVTSYGRHDFGGGAVPAEAAAHGLHDAGVGTSVPLLRGPTGVPDVRFRLVAQRTTIRLASGQKVEALTFDGRAPGPELRMQQGDLVEVTLVNRDVEPGVTIHWHGLDLPNAEDGVAGVTQDAVLPGASHTYRFRAEQRGTFWYHSHESSSTQVDRGLFGALVIEPRQSQTAETLDLALVSHVFDGTDTINGAPGAQHRRVAPGSDVRLRLVNADDNPKRFLLSGTPFRVLAIDGTDLHGPASLERTTLALAAGGRYDVGFTMPDRPVALRVEGTPALLALSNDGRTVAPAEQGVAATFDPLGYGEPSATRFDAQSTFQRRFRLEIGRKPGFLDGKPGMQWTINGGIYPDVPMLMVERGDLVRLEIVNSTSKVHPMHLHGHHALVLSRDGREVTGSPWWTDTLDVQPGERYELAFRADNPGLWMEHCHNLGHAAAGLTMHLGYAGVTTPFRTGGDAHNHPE